MPIKLNLGCGTRKKDGWVNIDSAAECRPDIRHDLSDPLPFGDLSVDEVLADAVLEHFDKYARHFIVYHWTRVLKVGGVITISVPNFQKIMHRYLKWKFDDFVDTIFGETMWESRYYIGHCGSHKWGYSEKSLKAFLEVFGITDVVVQKHGLVLTAQGRKSRHVGYEELKGLQVYSPNNACGTGKPYMTLAEIQKAAGFKV